MPVYGSTAGIKAILSATEGDDWDDTRVARMEALRQAVSRIVEMQTGAAFYGDPTDVVPEQRIVDTPGAEPWYGGVLGGNPAVLYLPWGLRSASGILAAPTWSGSAWTGGTTLLTSQYRLTGKNRDGIYRTITGIGYAWGGQYAITGVWEDQVTPVPDEIDYVVNYVAAEAFKAEQAGPAGFTGPDGATVPIRDALKDSKVKAILDHYTIGPGVWF